MNNVKVTTLTRLYLRIALFFSLFCIFVLGVLINRNFQEAKLAMVNDVRAKLFKSTAFYYSSLISHTLLNNDKDLQNLLDQIKIDEGLIDARFVLSPSEVGIFDDNCIDSTGREESIFTGPSCDHIENGKISVLQEIASGGASLGYLFKSRKIEIPNFPVFIDALWTLAPFVLIIVSFFVFFIHLLRRKLVIPLRDLARDASQLFVPSSGTSKYELTELQGLEQALKDAFEELGSLREKEIRFFTQEKIAEVTDQVAHDIRSPLAALEMLMGSLGELSEDKRTILRNAIGRIRDIANSLAPKYRAADTSKATLAVGVSNQNIENELIMPIVDALTTEKRLQYRDRLNVHIDFNQTRESYGLFSRINATELKRILSNLINNAIESFSEVGGNVTIELGAELTHNYILIRDNGCGIAPDLIAKLGEKGMTFNKEGGSGLGIHHAKTTVASWGGSLAIESKLGFGTQVRLMIPKQTPPAWFVPDLFLKRQGALVILDDDQSIHQIWRGRLESLMESQIRLIHLSTPAELRKFYGENFSNLDETTFLVDFEILNHAETGLDLIHELGLASQSILVTSRYEEPGVKSRCEKLGVRLIPKSMSGFVPISVS